MESSFAEGATRMQSHVKGGWRTRFASTANRQGC